MANGDYGMVVRKIANASTYEWDTLLNIYRRAMGLPDATGYNTRYRNAAQHLVDSEFLETKREAPRPSCNKTTYYRKVKDVYYSTVRNKRFNYLSYDELDAESRLVVRDFYPNLHPWLNERDYLYPVQTPRYKNGYIPVIVKAERILAIDEQDAERRRCEWRGEMIDAATMPDVGGFNHGTE